MIPGMRNIIALLAVLITVVSCENFYDDSDEYEEAIAMVESVRVDSVRNLTATVTFTCGTPTPCWSFSRIAETRDSNTIRMTLYRKVKKNITCIQVVGSFQQTITITVLAPGLYTLKIYRTPTTTTDTTIVF